jgi:hypothetical protein
MAKFVVTSTSVFINSIDVSASCARAELTLNASEVETTDFGSAGYVEVIGGLKSGTVSLDFHSDFGVGGVSETFADLIGTVIPIVLIAGNGTAASSTTPSYSFNALVTSFTPVSGAVGDLATFSVSFPTSGAVTVATS